MLTPRSTALFPVLFKKAVLLLLSMTAMTCSAAEERDYLAEAREDKKRLGEQRVELFSLPFTYTLQEGKIKHVLSEIEQLQLFGGVERLFNPLYEKWRMPLEYRMDRDLYLRSIRILSETKLPLQFPGHVFYKAIELSPDGKEYTFTTEPQCEAYTHGAACHKENGRWYVGAPVGVPLADAKAAMDAAREKVASAQTQDEKTAAQAELEKADADMKTAIVAGKDVATIETQVEANAKALGDVVEEGASGSTETIGGASGDSSAVKATGQAGKLAEQALVLDTNAKRLTENEAVLRDHTTRIEANREAIADVAQALGEQREVIREQAGAIDGNAQGIRENREGIGANTAAIRENGKGIAKNTSALVKQEETLTTLEEALTAQGRAIDGQTEIVRSLTKADLVFNEKLASLETSIREQEDTVREGLAMNAALSGLFKPYKVGHVNVTAALGGYKTEGALAVGTGYRVSNYVAMTLGLSTSLSRTSNLSSHLGVNINF